ncbi:MAG: ribosome-associated translation inhibitor RaiA [Orrella sp.]
MNVQITGHHLEVTPAIREYISSKLDRVNRHFDHVIDTKVILSVEPLKHRAEMTVHMRGKDIHCEAAEENLYAAIDLLADKIDRKVVDHKKKTQNYSHTPAKRQIISENEPI